MLQYVSCLSMPLFLLISTKGFYMEWYFIVSGFFLLCNTTALNFPCCWAYLTCVTLLSQPTILLTTLLCGDMRFLCKPHFKHRIPTVNKLPSQIKSHSSSRDLSIKILSKLLVGSCFEHGCETVKTKCVCVVCV